MTITWAGHRSERHGDVGAGRRTWWNLGARRLRLRRAGHLDDPLPAPALANLRGCREVRRTLATAMTALEQIPASSASR